MKEKVDKRVLGYYRTQTEKRKRWHLEDTTISYKQLKRRYMEELGSYVTEEE